jgi:hypothetical protein
VFVGPVEAVFVALVVQVFPLFFLMILVQSLLDVTFIHLVLLH